MTLTCPSCDVPVLNEEKGRMNVVSTLYYGWPPDPRVVTPEGGINPANITHRGYWCIKCGHKWSEE